MSRSEHNHEGESLDDCDRTIHRFSTESHFSGKRCPPSHFVLVTRVLLTIFNLPPPLEISGRYGESEGFI
jgi:hypothetical protein